MKTMVFSSNIYNIPRNILVLMGASVLLFLPTYQYLISFIWTQEQYSHGAIIPIIFIWLMWRNYPLIVKSSTKPDLLFGSILLITGLVLLIIGRRASLPLFETFAQIPYILGLVLILKGRLAASYLRFPLFFLLFMVPLPGIVIYALTSALKDWSAYVVVEFFYNLGYPVARDGVIILIGQYQLFLADACSGINSIYALSALGLLFIYLAKGRSTRRKIAMAIMVVPIAIFSNLVRIGLILFITYYFGDSVANQLHELLGFAIFIVAFAILFFIEKWLLELKR